MYERTVSESTRWLPWTITCCASAGPAIPKTARKTAAAKLAIATLRRLVIVNFINLTRLVLLSREFTAGHGHSAPTLWSDPLLSNIDPDANAGHPRRLGILPGRVLRVTFLRHVPLAANDAPRWTMSFQVANSISITTMASPMRNPISWARSLKGRPRSASIP